MKNYKKVKMVAKNAPSGSYAAGCPANTGGYGDCYNPQECARCERRR